MNLLEQFDALVVSLHDWFKIPVVRGYPRFGRIRIEVPSIALLFWGKNTMGTSNTLGFGMIQSEWRIVLFAQHERALLVLADSFYAWSKKAPGVTGEVVVTEFVRHMNRYELDVEDFALDIAFTLR
jgi:hypothetical protein